MTEQNENEREPWIIEHESLYDRQKLIAFSNCHNGVIGQIGWIPGWMTCYPHAHVVIDLGEPTLVTKLSVKNTNVLASPRTMELLYSTSGPEGPWVPAYRLHRTQTNRMSLQVPPNTDTTDSESNSIESFYLFGHCSNDMYPEWSMPWQSPFEEQDLDSMSSRGLITAIGDTEDANVNVNVNVSHWPVARYWMVKIMDANGLHYIGMNGLALFGRIDPLPSPEDVVVSRVDANANATATAIVVVVGEAVLVSWSPPQPTVAGSTSCVGYKVVAFSGDTVGCATGGFQKTCEGINTSSMIFDRLLPGSTYVFVVMAMDAEGREGAPSRVSCPITIPTGHPMSSEEWVIVDDDTGPTGADEHDDWESISAESSNAPGPRLGPATSTLLTSMKEMSVNEAAAAVKLQKAMEKKELRRAMTLAKSRVNSRAASVAKKQTTEEYAAASDR